MDTTGDEQLFELLYDAPTRENVVHFLAFDDRNPNSIWSCIQAARENARTIREVITTPMWKELNKFYHLVRTTREHPLRKYPYDFCARVKLASHVLIGVTDATMSHGEAWHFGRVGRLIERADKTSRIVDVQYYVLLPDPKDVGTSLDLVRWSALLKSASALEMYRREHGRIEPRKVAAFLILNRQFPRSMRFAIVKTLDSLREITGSAQATFTNRVEQLLGRLCSELDYATSDDIFERGVHEFIDNFQGRLNEIGIAFEQQFFRTRPRDVYAPVGGASALEDPDGNRDANGGRPGARPAGCIGGHGGNPMPVRVLDLRYCQVTAVAGRVGEW